VPTGVALRSDRASCLQQSRLAVATFLGRDAALLRQASLERASCYLGKPNIGGTNGKREADDRRPALLLERREQFKTALDSHER
jgi:hypothetical protein